MPPSAVIRATLFGGYEARHLVELAKVAVTAAPEAADPHYYFGILLLRQGQPDAGRRSISSAVRLTGPESHGKLDDGDATDFGLSLAAAGEYELADRYLAGHRGSDAVFARLLVDELRLLQRLPGGREALSSGEQRGAGRRRTCRPSEEESSARPSSISCLPGLFR